MNGKPLSQRERNAKFRASPRGRYYVHRWNAFGRAVPFHLTFDEWWAIWEASGHWQERGNRKGRYCMCRIADEGAYAIGNVYIGKLEVNVRERNAQWGFGGPKAPARASLPES